MGSRIVRSLVLAAIGCGHGPSPTAASAAPAEQHHAVVPEVVEASPDQRAEEPVVRWQPVRAESFDRAARPSVEAACGRHVAAAARELRLDDVSSCRVVAYANGSERLLVVTFDYGPVQDCPSGCFQEHASAIVRGDRIVGVPTPRVALESPYAFVRRYLEEELARRSLPLTNHVGVRYDFLMPDGWCANYHDRVALETRGDEVRWVIEIPPTRCTPNLPGPSGGGPAYSVELEGTIAIPIAPAEGTYPVPDFSGMQLSVDGA